MAKKLDPKKIEAGRKARTRMERRGQKAQKFHDDINRSRESGGVIVIPPSKSKSKDGGTAPKLRVAAYCRVSTQEEEQVGSFEMQVHHFEERISNNPAWTLVEIFKDNGISARSTIKRVGFQNMMAAALDGQIDLMPDAEFISGRASFRGVDEADYREKMHGIIHLEPNGEYVLCFGEDDCCRANLAFMLAYLKRIGCVHPVRVRIVNEITLEVIREYTV